MKFKSNAYFLVVAATCCLIAGTAAAQPSLLLYAPPSACGGTLNASGAGWGQARNTVKLTADGLSGSGGHAQEIGVAVANRDTFFTSIGWSYRSGSKDCGKIFVMATVTATGEHGEKVSSKVYLPGRCKIVWSPCKP